jgi:hypothetical protein
MADQAAHTVAQITEQCRREIAAAWTHVEGAREVLRRSRWLHERWTAQIATAAAEPATGSPELAPHHPRSLGFVMVPSTGRPRRRRRSASGR